MDNGASSYLRFLNGDKEGFVEIVKEYRNGLVIFINVIVGDIHISEEAADNALMKLYIKKPKYRMECSFKAWLYTIGKNAALDYIKKFRRKSYVPIDDYYYLTDETDIEADYICNEQNLIKTQSGIIPADIHEIKGISPNYAVIARMDNTSDLMIGVNNAYLPVTLHSLFRDIGLNDYWKTDNKDFDILEKLLQLPDCKLEQFVSPGKSIKDYEIECELLSISDTLISLTEKGYLIFSQNGNSFVFFVDNNIKLIIEGDSNELI